MRNLGKLQQMFSIKDAIAPGTPSVVEWSGRRSGTCGSGDDVVKGDADLVVSGWVGDGLMGTLWCVVCLMCFIRGEKV